MLTNKCAQDASSRERKHSRTSIKSRFTKASGIVFPNGGRNAAFGTGCCALHFLPDFLSTKDKGRGKGHAIRVQPKSAIVGFRLEIRCQSRRYRDKTLSSDV